MKVKHTKLIYCLALLIVVGLGCNKKPEIKTDNSKQAEGQQVNVENPQVNNEKTKQPDSTATQAKGVINVENKTYENDKFKIEITDLKSKRISKYLQLIPLLVMLKVDNLQKDKNLFYPSWTPDASVAYKIRVSTVEDEHGKVYDILPVRGRKHDQQTIDVEIKPGESITDMLQFNEIAPNAKKLKLTLVGNELTDGKDLVFKFDTP
ncbi:hypothetical protein [Gimesia aquarii]|uniref:Lipoprotein n=1 Tax=Gimesia aquarii TaxID=2527964 RepID=A0A517WNN1_9PLAN|nr:hypothetical protein [Gimesia aquarii]QDU06843.1 hypothetical protein V202x_01860 [Gimesia aquarii]